MKLILVSNHIGRLYFTVIFVFLLQTLISLSHAIKWIPSGTGMDSRVNVPVRSFYVELYDDNGAAMDARDLGDLDTVSFNAKSNGKKVAMRKTNGVTWDGRLMFRYRLAESTRSDVTMHIEHRDKEVLQFDINGPMYDEACHCPMELDEFYAAYKCPAYFKQLDADLAHFETVDLDKLKTAGDNKKWRTEATIHYVIKDQQIYSKRLGTITDFKMFVDGMMHSLVRKVKLPDVEFVFNVGDWPIERDLADPLPVFSWCGSNKTADIIFPTWDQAGWQNDFKFPIRHF